MSYSVFCKYLINGQFKHYKFIIGIFKFLNHSIFPFFLFSFIFLVLISIIQMKTNKEEQRTQRVHPLLNESDQMLPVTLLSMEKRERLASLMGTQSHLTTQNARNVRLSVLRVLEFQNFSLYFLYRKQIENQHDSKKLMNLS